MMSTFSGLSRLFGHGQNKKPLFPASPPPLESEEERRRRIAGLNERELRVFQCICAERDTQGIATALDISLFDAKMLEKQVCRKLGAENCEALRRLYDY